MPVAAISSNDKKENEMVQNAVQDLMKAVEELGEYE
eukprot:CAMPEP_0198148082 /NCGR_PEP_ID=MMETSP1443-20131203/39658_1 /TAXON_ID=186043 /ORGANISM="Entomoneis sp., Strain CCMP2396" /LENGTH=35 /DNA_ID= /DNA_START= /DNA_END= /DNA_ORIENTATION=